MGTPVPPHRQPPAGHRAARRTSGRWNDLRRLAVDGWTPFSDPSAVPARWALVGDRFGHQHGSERLGTCGCDGSVWQRLDLMGPLRYGVRGQLRRPRAQLCAARGPRTRNRRRRNNSIRGARKPRGRCPGAALGGVGDLRRQLGEGPRARPRRPPARRLEIVCYDGGQWKSPAEISFDDPLAAGSTGESRPQLLFDPDGNLWMSFKRRYSRHSYRPTSYLGVLSDASGWESLDGPRHPAAKLGAMVYTLDTSRESIHDAIRKRRTYGATDNIVLDFRIGEAFQGEATAASEPRRIRVRARGTDTIARIHLIRDASYIYKTDFRTGASRSRVRVRISERPSRAGGALVLRPCGTGRWGAGLVEPDLDHAGQVGLAGEICGMKRRLFRCDADQASRLPVAARRECLGRGNDLRDSIP